MTTTCASSYFRLLLNTMSDVAVGAASPSPPRKQITITQEVVHSLARGHRQRVPLSHASSTQAKPSVLIYVGALLPIRRPRGNCAGESKHAGAVQRVAVASGLTAACKKSLSESLPTSGRSPTIGTDATSAACAGVRSAFAGRTAADPG